MKGNPRVSIILVNWNQKQDISECLGSILNIEYDNYGVIVVDNNSKDGSIELIKNNFPWVRLIENESNLGFCKANNLGIEEALRDQSGYIFIINSDTIVEKDILKKMLSIMESNPNIGIAQPIFYHFQDRDRIWHMGGIIDLDHGHGPRAVKTQVNQEIGYFHTDFITGCGMLVKKEVFERIGLFDEDYFFSFEDIDFALRAKRYGFNLVTVSDASIWHKVSSSTGGEYSPRRIYYYSRNRILFLKKHRTKSWYVYLLSELPEYSKTFLSLLLKKGSMKSSFALLKGIMDCFMGIKGYGRPPSRT